MTLGASVHYSCCRNLDVRQYVISNQIYFFRQKFDSEGGGKNLSLTGVCVCVFFGGGDFFIISSKLSI